MTTTTDPAQHQNSRKFCWCCNARYSSLSLCQWRSPIWVYDTPACISLPYTRDRNIKSYLNSSKKEIFALQSNIYRAIQAVWTECQKVIRHGISESSFPFIKRIVYTSDNCDYNYAKWNVPPLGFRGFHRICYPRPLPAEVVPFPSVSWNAYWHKKRNVCRAFFCTEKSNAVLVESFSMNASSSIFHTGQNEDTEWKNCCEWCCYIHLTYLSFFNVVTPEYHSWLSRIPPSARLSSPQKKFLRELIFFYNSHICLHWCFAWYVSCKTKTDALHNLRQQFKYFF